MERIRKWGLRALITLQGIGWIGVIFFLLDLQGRWEALKHYEEVVYAHIFYVLAFLLGFYSAYVIVLHFAVRRLIRQVKKQLGLVTSGYNVQKCRICVRQNGILATTPFTSSAQCAAAQVGAWTHHQSC
jgi:hypothetical protein